MLNTDRKPPDDALKTLDNIVSSATMVFAVVMACLSLTISLAVNRITDRGNLDRHCNNDATCNHDMLACVTDGKEHFCRLKLAR